MKFLNSLVLFAIFVLLPTLANAQTIGPSFVKGGFIDDYGIEYSINDTLWVQHPDIKYHIVKWNIKEQYLIAKNGSGHRADENKYTRIDFMTFDEMAPWQWGFCLTVYKAKSDKEAEEVAAADRKNPRKGCNSYPFSRMKPISDR